MAEETIQQIVERRRIGLLFHFTRVDNLEGILTYGLLPKTSFETYSVKPVVNDGLRLDACPNASNLSISFPNYKMFYSYRMTKPDVKWVVLGFEPRVLWLKDCAFCVENAAKASVVAVAVNARKGPAALEKLFAEFPGKPSRSDLKLPDNWPTNPQAEVLVFDRIEPDLLVGAAFNDRALADAWKGKFGAKQCVVNWEFFSWRRDFKTWQ